MSEKDNIYIKIHQSGMVEAQYRAYYKKTEKGNYRWFIPGFNIRFTSKDMEIGEKRAFVMVKYFMHYWDTKGSFREFLLEIHRLGFRAPKNHDLTLSRVIKKIEGGKFISPVLEPKDPGYSPSRIQVVQAAAF